MSRHASLPSHFYINVQNKALGLNDDLFTRALWHGVFARSGQLILCHVMLEPGAHWSGLPLHMITTGEIKFSHEQLMPWKAMGEDIDVVQMYYLEGLVVKTRLEEGRHTGVVVDWKDGYSRYQQEHKPLNLIHLNCGQFALLPNNYCTFNDAHFTVENKDLLKKYRRGEDIYWE